MILPDITSIVRSGAAPWLYLPIAVLLGALHALEPGHSKSVMAAFIVAVRGTVGQAVLLGLSAAIGHTLIIWILAAIGLKFANAHILDQIEPWLVLISGLIILLLAIRLLRSIHPHHHHAHDHDHHDHDHHHHGHKHMDGATITATYGNRAVTSAEVIRFGFVGGLTPCPAAFAVLLVCLQLKKVALGFAMVGAFSAGLALTLVGIGVVAAAAHHHARQRLSGFDQWADRLPYISGALVLVLGLAMTIRGLIATHLLPGL